MSAMHAVGQSLLTWNFLQEFADFVGKQSDAIVVRDEVYPAVVVVPVFVSVVLSEVLEPNASSLLVRVLSSR